MKLIRFVARTKRDIQYSLIGYARWPSTKWYGHFLGRSWSSCSNLSFVISSPVWPGVFLVYASLNTLIDLHNQRSKNWRYVYVRKALIFFPSIALQKLWIKLVICHRPVYMLNKVDDSFQYKNSYRSTYINSLRLHSLSILASYPHMHCLRLLVHPDVGIFKATNLSFTCFQRMLLTDDLQGEFRPRIARNA